MVYRLFQVLACTCTFSSSIIFWIDRPRCLSEFRRISEMSSILLISSFSSL